MTLTDFTARELLVPIFVDGKQVYECPDIHQISAYAKKEFASMWDEYKRLLMPHTYKVDLSDDLYDLKQRLLRDAVGARK
jgi:nicotinate phosphoribosyltransferase